LGDAVMALPALAAVRRALPSTHLTIAAVAAIAPVFEEDTPAAPDAVMVIPDRRREIAILSEGKFDGALLLTNSFRSAWTMKRARIGERWGYSANLRGFLLTRSLGRPRERVHQSKYYSILVERLGFELSESLPRITVRADTARRADEMLTKHGITRSTRVVGFAPGAAYGHAKRWPPARVADVVARVSARVGAVSILFGAHGDREAGREIESSVPAGAPLVNLIGRTDLRQLAGILARCSAFVSNDSGAMHLAAALGVPVTGIFGPTDERVTAPLGDHDVILQKVFCRPCMLRDCPIDHRCMRRISSDQVFEAVSARLAAAETAAARPSAGREGAGVPGRAVID
jgi:heptosyltransferase-2